MTKSIEQFLTEQPRAIHPSYNTLKPNTPIVLYSGKLGLSISNQKTIDQGLIYLKWLPYPGLNFQLKNLPSTLPFELGKSKLELIKRKIEIDAFVSHINPKVGITKDLPSVSGFLNRRVIIGKNEPVQYVQFHLTNFSDFVGDTVSYVSDSGFRIGTGRLIIEANDWKIIIDSVKHLDQLVQSLNYSGGFGITHVGIFGRSDSKKFDQEQAQNFIEALGYFLSFVRGLWNSPILCNGFDEKDKLVWKEWIIRRLDTWQGVQTWFDDFMTKSLQGVFHGFLKRWEKDDWRDSIRLAISWYIESNKQEGGMEGSLIMIQAALELLSWVYFVEKSGLTPDFDKLPASDKVRLLLLQMGINREIPTLLSALSKYASTKNINWIDGPHAITDVRNGIIHPKTEKRTRIINIPNEVKYELWKLSLWYLELILLRLFGYSGDYANRLQNIRYRGQLEPVPWSL
jgi:hypothetical protein